NQLDERSSIRNDANAATKTPRLTLRQGGLALRADEAVTDEEVCDEGGCDEGRSCSCSDLAVPPRRARPPRPRPPRRAKRGLHGHVAWGPWREVRRTTDVANHDPNVRY